MKCPYCGAESKEQHCVKCKAWIPVPAEKPKENAPEKAKKNKE